MTKYKVGDTVTIRRDLETVPMSKTTTGTNPSMLSKSGQKAEIIDARYNASGDKYNIDLDEWLRCNDYFECNNFKFIS